jgi:7-cyano-7-deazaguanine synthase
MSRGKTVVILSGGMDSTTLLYDAIARGLNPVALTFDYGQRHGKEITFAMRTTDKIRVPWELADLRKLTKFLAGSALTSSEIDVPHGHYAADSMKATVVPNRNMIMLSIAIAWAVVQKADAVSIGVHGGDHTIYPDCRPSFYEPMLDAARVANWHPVEIWTPFMRMSKADIVTRGHELAVPWGETWSCYEGDELHCGKCGTCVERKEAFALAGVPDPTTYDTALHALVD